MAMSPEPVYAQAMTAADEDEQAAAVPDGRLGGVPVRARRPAGGAAATTGAARAAASRRGRPTRASAARKTRGWSGPTSAGGSSKQLSGEAGLPLVLVLEPIAHYDLADLPDDHAAELGLLRS